MKKHILDNEIFGYTTKTTRILRNTKKNENTFSNLIQLSIHNKNNNSLDNDTFSIFTKKKKKKNTTKYY